MPRYKIISDARITSTHHDLKNMVGKECYECEDKREAELAKFGPVFEFNMEHRCVTLDPAQGKVLFIPPEDLETVQ